LLFLDFDPVENFCWPAKSHQQSQAQEVNGPVISCPLASVLSNEDETILRANIIVNAKTFKDPGGGDGVSSGGALLGDELARGGAFSDELASPYIPPADHPLLGQTFDFSCVAASCRMLLADFGVNIPEAFVRSAAGVDIDGAFLRNLPQALKNIGEAVDRPELTRFVYIREQSVDRLEAALGNGPVAANIRTSRTGGLHAIVIDKIENGRVFIRDPLPVGIGSGQSISLDDFSPSFTGNIVFRE